MTVQVPDDDVASVVFSVVGSRYVSEGSGEVQVTLQLTSMPLDSVTVTLADASDEVISDPSEVTFTNSNWDTAQTVTITAQDDSVVDPMEMNVTVVIDTSTSLDEVYAALPPQSIEMSCGR